MIQDEQGMLLRGDNYPCAAESNLKIPTGFAILIRGGGGAWCN